MNYSMEVGPIRPPSEAESLLLRLTRNCTWNKCSFCNVYKGKEFSRRPVEEIKNDINTMAYIRDELEKSAGKIAKGRITQEAIADVANSNITLHEEISRVGYWLYSGAKTVFLQDANSLVMKTKDLVDILNYLKEKFPSIERITTYARSKTVSNKSLEELKDLRAVGLSRIHVGMESGSDKVLELVNKGVTAADHISAGQKAMAAGFDLSEYYMPGLGGKELWEENAVESARVLNAINPTFIRIRSTVPVPNTPLYRMMLDKKWTAPNDEEKVKELRLFIEKLEGITSTLLSDHIMNLLEDLGGDFPHGKKDMLMLIDQFLGMNQEDKENFILGRRLGYIRFLSDYRRDSNIAEIKKQLLEKIPNIDEAVLQILRNYI